MSLATRLREDGVDVILDKWDLKPGHDSYKFMESMVTDEAVTKVLMICDKIYAEKANARSGGVGAESQIISPQLYKQSQQDKFAALMTDEDEAGNAHIPVFYQGRIFFDFRSGDKFEEGYEQLLRWLVDRPLHIKPKLGSVPAAILAAAPVASGTQSHMRRAEQAIRDGSPKASALVREFGDQLRAELKVHTPQFNGEPEDETILAASQAMRPYLRQYVELVSVAVRHSHDALVWERLLGVLEQVGTLMYRDPGLMQWNGLQFDAHKIIAYEAFLSTIALALDEERFDLVRAATERSYLMRDRDGEDRPSTSDFSEFRHHLRSLEMRKQRLNSNRILPHADLVHEAYPSNSLPSFESLMQADLVLYLRAEGDNEIDWCPITLVYAANRFSPFPIFARSESAAYMLKVMPILNVSGVENFKSLIEGAAKSQRTARLYEHHGLPISHLTNLKHLGIRA